jgi:hypothetical protein
VGDGCDGRSWNGPNGFGQSFDCSAALAGGVNPNEFVTGGVTFPVREIEDFEISQ